MDFIYERCGNCQRKGAYVVVERGFVRCKYCAVNDADQQVQSTNLASAAAGLRVQIEGATVPTRAWSTGSTSARPATVPATAGATPPRDEAMVGAMVLEGGVLPMELGTIRALATGAAKARSKPAEKAAPTISPRAKGRGPTALVIDDDELTRTLIAAILERGGFSVSQAGSGEEACAAVAADPPDIALVDLSMPGMDGLEVLVELRRRVDLGLVVVSGRANEGDRVIALELGADDYVSKPFTPAVLLARVQGVLARCGRLELAAAP